MKKYHSIRLLSTVLISFWGITANADWIEPGTAYKCDRSNGSFAIRAFMNTSSGEAIPLDDDFKLLPNNQNRITCNFKDVRVKAMILAQPPKATGTCAGNGIIQLSLNVNGKSVLADELFNSGCFFSPVIYKLDVTSQQKQKKPKIIICRGTWDWSKNYVDGVCSVEK